VKIVETARIREPIPAVVCIGVFDGVHLGHREVIGGCVEEALRLGRASAVITFENDPESVLSPERRVPQLSSLEQKRRLISLLGPDYLVSLLFTPELAALSPQEFLDDYLLRTFRPAELVVGANFRFGAGGTGDVEVLRGYGSLHGFDVAAMPLLSFDGRPISSTRIRALLGEGRVSEAGRLLGRPYALAGEVVAGSGRGGELGFHTANVAVDPALCVPCPGVYAGAMTAEGREWPAAVNVGTRPTFEEEGAVWVEAHAIGMDGVDLYGARIEIVFLERLRDERRFAGREELAEQIAADARVAVTVFERRLGRGRGDVP